jgi:predicted MFS family arabinose efflux permease
VRDAVTLPVPPAGADLGEREGVAKLVMYIGITVGCLVGGYVPTALFGVGGLSWQSLLCGFIGGVAGAWLGWKLVQWVEE